MFGDTFF